MSKIYIVGLGPGSMDDITFRAKKALDESQIIIGYDAYIQMIKEYFPDKEYISSKMTKEVERCRQTLKKALEGKTVSIISSGDSGIYGMAGVMLQTIQKSGADIDVDIVPGLTSASASAAVLGAPVMHDFAVISLSDLLTPLHLIQKRIANAADGDFVICIYNPRSKKRHDYMEKAAEIILKYRDPKTPAGIVKNASRIGQCSIICTLSKIPYEEIDMFSTVIIGNSQTYVKDGKMITPRGYQI